MSRRPNRDLPAIPEVATPNEIDEVDDDNTIESYAFTLDGVGFDEESGSILQTPNSVLMSPDRIGTTRRDEMHLHAQTCRTLGIPYSTEMNTGSPRGSVQESVESTSTGSCTVRGDCNLFDVPLEKEDPNTKDAAPRGSSESKPSRRLITRAKIAELTSSYANSIKDIALSFSAKSKNLYANSKPKFLTQDGSQVYKSGKKPSFDLNEWYPAWIKDANALTKLAVAISVFFVTLLIMIVVVVSNTKHGPQISQSETNLIDAGRLSTALNDTALVSMNTVGENQAVTSMPSYLPTMSPTFSKLGIEGSNLCVDNPGKYETSRGKARTCTWLQAKHLDRECGGSGKSPTELGLNCKLTCREYNDCDTMTTALNVTPTVKPTDVPTNKPTKRERGKKKTHGLTLQPSSTDIGLKESTTTTTTTAAAAAEDEVQYFVDTDNRLRPCNWLDILNTKQRIKRRQANCIRESVYNICPTSCAEFVQDDEVTSTSTPSLAATDTEAYFSDSTGKQRPCTWLDVRNPTLKTKRRDDNCDKVTVQIICSSSCEDYALPVTVSRMKEDVIILSRSDFLRKNDLDLQDNCFDTQGYFLNEQGHAVKCAWLTDAGVGAEEILLRKERNCGLYQASTDLGNMCKSSCGTC